MAVADLALAPGAASWRRVVTRSQRQWHIRAWLVLAPLIVLGLISALLGRPPVLIPADETSGDRAEAPNPASKAEGLR